MGKPLIHQRRGKGSPSFKAPSKRFKVGVEYRPNDGKELLRGEVLEFIDNPAHTALLMRVRYEDGTEAVTPASEGLFLGETVYYGENAPAELGSTLPLRSIPEGFPVYNIETRVGDGGSIIRSSGLAAYITSKDQKHVYVKLPSKKIKKFNANCRATIGLIAGGGRKDKPLLKAGAAHYKNKVARNKWWPRVRGVHMNAVDHPYGGKQHHGAKTKKGKGAPAGQHVGSFGARRTGRRKR